MKKIANLRVFPTILLGMIVGISFIILTDLWLPAVITAAAGVKAVCAVVVLRTSNAESLKSAAIFCISFVLGAAFGLSSAAYANAAIERKEIFAEGAEITAKIEVGNAFDLDGTVNSRYVVLTDLEINGKEIDGKAKLNSTQMEGGEFKEGDVIKFVGNVVTVTTDITTPYKASALSEGILYEITCDDEDTGGIAVTGQSLDLFDKIKKAVAQKLKANAPEDTARFMYAMLFGDSAVIGESLKSGFSYTGTAHLLAVSGLHVGMIAGALFFILKALKVNIYVRNATVVAVLLFFCAMCGFSPSTVRATIMVTLCMVAGMAGLRYDALSGMSFAAIILLFVSPYNLYSLGFLMSFTAVYGLILFAKPVQRALTRIRCPKTLAGAMAATVAANITLLPILMYVFGDVSLIFALANCIIVPLAGIFFPLYVVALPLSFIPYAGFVTTAVSLPFTAMAYFVKLLAKTQFPAVYFDFTWATVILWLMAATAVSSLSGIPVAAKKIIASVLIICFISAVAVQNTGMLSADNRITCFSSGGSAGVLVQSQEEGDFLIFAGELDEAGLESALSAVKDGRLRKIDFIVKYEFSQEESDLLDQSLEELGMPDVYTLFTPSLKANVIDIYSVAAVASVICNYGYTQLYLGGVDVFIAGGEDGQIFAEGYDVVVNPNAQKLPEGAQYLISDRAYYDGGRNCLPSDFTFWTEGDRIIKTNKWRFA